MKFTKLYEKTVREKIDFYDVDQELVSKILYSKKTKKKFRLISRGDGWCVIWFRHDYVAEQCIMSMENDEREKWFKTREQKFTVSDDYDNYNLIVIEFKSEHLLSHEESEYIEGMVRAYYDIKEDDGRYTIFDVYSPSELGL